MNIIKCPKCGSEKTWKVGKPKGKQQYQCKECKRKFFTEFSFSPEFKNKAIQIFYEGNSGRAVGRLMGINKSTVYNWIKALDNKTKYPKPVESKITKDIIEMDELFSYVANKKNKLI